MLLVGQSGVVIDFYLENLFTVTGVSHILLVGNNFFCPNTNILLKYDYCILTNLAEVCDYNLDRKTPS